MDKKARKKAAYQKWNGTMPHMVPPGNAPMLLQIPNR